MDVLNYDDFYKTGEDSQSHLSSNSQASQIEPRVPHGWPEPLDLSGSDEVGVNQLISYGLSYSPLVAKGEPVRPARRIKTLYSLASQKEVMDPSPDYTEAQNKQEENFIKAEFERVRSLPTKEAPNSNQMFSCFWEESASSSRQQRYSQLKDYCREVLKLTKDNITELIEQLDYLTDSGFSEKRNKISKVGTDIEQPIEAFSPDWSDDEVKLPKPPKSKDLAKAWLRAWSENSLKEKQQEDPLIQAVMAEQAGALPEDDRSLTARNARIIAKSVVTGPDGLMYRVIRTYRDKKRDPEAPVEDQEIVKQLLVPYVLQKPLIAYVHRGTHLGSLKTYFALTEEFYWPGMYADIARFISFCKGCRLGHGPARGPSGELQQVITEGFLDRINIDYAGSFQLCNGFTHVLIIVENSTKLLWLAPTTGATSDEAARVLWSYVYTQWGFPRRIISDNGTHFIDAMLKELTRYLKSTQVHTTTYYSQSNGLSERFVGWLQVTLRKMAEGGYAGSWAHQLGAIQMAFRAVPNSVTGIAPIQLATGRVGNYPYRTLLMPIDPRGKQHKLMRRFPRIVSNLELFRKIATHNLQQAYQRQKAYWDKHHKPPLLLEIGQTVLLKDKRPVKGLTKKLRCPHFPNVFQIVQSWPEKNIYKLWDTTTGKEVKGWFNGAHLTVFKPWDGPDAYEELIEEFLPPAERASQDSETSQGVSPAATTHPDSGTSDTCTDEETESQNSEIKTQESPQSETMEFDGDIEFEASQIPEGLLEEPVAIRREKRATAGKMPARYR